MGGGASLSDAIKKDSPKDVTRLIRKGQCDVNARDSEDQSPLLLACLTGNLELVSLLLNAGAKPNLYLHTGGGGTAVHFASIGGFTEIVRILLSAGANIRSKTGKGLSALHLACEMNHVDTAKLLLQNADADVIDAKDNDGDTALMLALRLGHLETVYCLLEAGANTSIINRTGLCPFLWCCQEGKCKVLEKLLRAGADPTIKNNNGTCGMHLASENGHIAIVKTLLDIGSVYVDTQDSALMTSLHIATRNGNNGLVTLLLEYGADTTVVNRKGQTALLIACQEGHLDTTLLLIKLAVCAVNVNTAAADGWTALHWAAANGMTDVVNTILEAIPTVQVDKPSKFGNETALMLAAKGGFQYIVYLLLLRGADANFDPGDGRTALYWASESDHKNIVRMLIEA